MSDKENYFITILGPTYKELWEKVYTEDKIFYTVNHEDGHIVGKFDALDEAVSYVVSELNGVVEYIEE